VGPTAGSNEHHHLRSHPMLKRPFSLVVAVLLVLSLGACSALGRRVFTPPTVLVESVRLVGVGFSGGTVDIAVFVFNPNKFDLDSKRVNYTVMVDTIPLGSGTITDRLVVGAKDSALVRIPVTFGLPQILAAGSKFLQGGSIPYRFVGDITVGSPIGDITRKFDQRGTFNTTDIR
jgi:LEA14-like dessication related protein